MAENNTDAQVKSQPPKPNPALVPLERLVGEWIIEGSMVGQSTGIGRTKFEWMEDMAFLVQHSEAAQPEFPSATMIIGRDEVSETYCVLYFDSRAVSRIYQMRLDDNTWMLWREAPGFWQRFVGTFSEDGGSIHGRWEKSSDGATWEHDFDLTYAKMR